MRPYLELPLQRSGEEMVVVQPFGANPETYKRFGLHGHNGVDFATEDGEMVVAVDEGELVELRLDSPGYGLTVKLSHAWGESRYAHGRWLSVPIEFELGRIVRQGERIFLACGGHIHLGLRIRRDDGSLDYSSANGFGGYEDPLPWLPEGLRLRDEPSPAARLRRREGRVRVPSVASSAGTTSAKT